LVPIQLAVSVNARQGAVRLLDLSGNLLSSRELPPEWANPPLDAAATPDGALLVLARKLEDRTAHGLLRLDLSRGGETVAPLPPGVNPDGVAAAPDGGAYLLDATAHLVHHVARDGRPLATFGGRGPGRGSFNEPRALEGGVGGQVLVLDHGNRQVQRLDRDGTYLNRYSFRLKADSADLRTLDGAALGSDGSVYVSDANGSRIRTVRPDGSQGQTYQVTHLSGDDPAALLEIAVDPEGNVFAARRGGHLIRRYAPDGRLTATIDAYAQVLSLSIAVVSDPAPSRAG
ncbi:MAG TPA: NHL repeat-containing protein, partial [Deinococcales bacterium]|nr:NHL repeat-containing protein [Deinococcales bacterium]